MTHDLADKFTILTDDYPDPVDPAVLVRGGIKRGRRKRRTAVALVGTAAVTALALGAAPFAGALLKTEAPVSAPASSQQLPGPWLDKPVVGAPGLYTVADGKIGRTGWVVASMPGGCVTLRNALMPVGQK